MSGLVVPDRVGEPIRAFRMWRLDARRELPRGRLPSVPNRQFGSLLPFNQIAQVWPGRSRTRAVCQAWETKEKRFTHEAPDPDCRCGLYGLRRLEWVEEPLLHLLSEKLHAYATSAVPRRGPAVGQPREHWLAAGSVLLWGKVIEGTWGYRAQHGYPETLWLLPPARIGGADPTVINENDDHARAQPAGHAPPPLPLPRRLRSARHGRRRAARLQRARLVLLLAPLGYRCRPPRSRTREDGRSVGGVADRRRGAGALA